MDTRLDFNERPFIVIWETTQACDLACVHCRACAQPLRDKLELSTFEAKKLIDGVAELRAPVFVMTGGDPLMLSARRLRLMRPDAYVVNTARGEVIDENALTRMIEAGELAGAGLDVFEHEPAVNPKLLRLARAGKVVLLPHMGSATMEGRIDMGEKVIINIRTFMDGHRPPDRVLPSML